MVGYCNLLNNILMMDVVRDFKGYLEEKISLNPWCNYGINNKTNNFSNNKRILYHWKRRLN